MVLGADGVVYEIEEKIKAFSKYNAAKKFMAKAFMKNDAVILIDRKHGAIIGQCWLIRKVLP